MAVLASAVSAQAGTISIATVPVGDAGNVADSFADSSNPLGQGQVNYNYNIGKYDVTLAQYTTFLNDVARSDPYALYNTDLATDVNVAGISRSGASGSYSYSVIGDGARPVTYVCWFDAVRFVNWLANGQPTGAEGNGTTETGTYTITGGGPNSGTVTVPDTAQRAAWAAGNSGVHWLLPDEDEWYKAAYYKSGGTKAGYWTYPTCSNTAPTSQAPPGGSNSANFDGNNGYALTQSPSLLSTVNYLTDVGAYANSPGPYGTYDMGGDVYQWSDWDWTTFSAGEPLRGGSWWTYLSTYMASYYRASDIAVGEVDDIGFRVEYWQPGP